MEVLMAVVMFNDGGGDGGDDENENDDGNENGSEVDKGW